MSGKHILNISFPKNGFVSAYELRNSEIKRRFTDVQDPLILILGWAGGLDRHVSKYSDIWDEKNCITARYCVPASDGFSAKDTGTPAAAAIIKELNERVDLKNNRPVLIHSFSNGGTSIYRRIIENENYANLNIIGNIIDSAPGKRRLTSGIKAYNSALTAMQIPTIFRYLQLGFFILRSIAKVLWQKLFGRSNLIYQYLKFAPMKWSEAYVFSKKDDVILFEDVKEIIDHRRQHNKTDYEIQSLELDDSEHVQHLRKYRDIYKNFCFNFLDKCYKNFYEISKL